jgi:hypothetical protein
MSAYGLLFQTRKNSCPLTSFTVTVDNTGAFKFVIPLSRNAKGTYTLCVSYQTQNTPALTPFATPENDLNIVADGPLTFGRPGDVTGPEPKDPVIVALSEN